MSKKYTIKEIFYSIQGEGINAGRPALFCRFTGCNLWSGREEDREKAECSFCDTDFVGSDESGGSWDSALELAAHLRSIWTKHTKGGRALLVCTGGEPALQLDTWLVECLRHSGFEIAIETNGTRWVTPDIHHVCVSPKAGSKLEQTHGDELKLVYPQRGLDPADFEKLDFGHFLLQPMDGENLEENTRKVVQYCLDNPKWRVSLQAHKLLGLR